MNNIAKYSYSKFMFKVRTEHILGTANMSGYRAFFLASLSMLQSMFIAIFLRTELLRTERYLATTSHIAPEMEKNRV